ncbi:MAG TPA: hypothetical protein VIJ25_13275 [Methylococcales bacterium]
MHGAKAAVITAAENTYCCGKLFYPPSATVNIVISTFRYFYGPISASASTAPAPPHT